MQRRAQGTTAVAMLVDADGHPSAVRVLRSSGDARLDEAAVRAAQKWEFVAATSNAKVVPRWGRLEVNFNLSQYRQQHPNTRDTRDVRQGDVDPLAVLMGLIRSWQEPTGSRSRDSYALDLLTPALSARLQSAGAVRNVRFLGVADRPSEGALRNDSQAMRTLDSAGLVGWDVFEVTQLRGTSQWYCAMDASGRIRSILAEAP